MSNPSFALYIEISNVGIYFQMTNLILKYQILDQLDSSQKTNHVFLPYSEEQCKLRKSFNNFYQIIFFIRCQFQGLIYGSHQFIRGYTTPEYAVHRQLIEEVDVYSYGIVVLEIVSGREVVDRNLQEDIQILLQWVRGFKKKYYLILV